MSQTKQLQSGAEMICTERARQIFQSTHKSLADDQQYHSYDVFGQAAKALISNYAGRWPEQLGGIPYFNALTRISSPQQRYAMAGAMLAAGVDYMNTQAVYSNIAENDSYQYSVDDFLAQFIPQDEKTVKPIPRYAPNISKMSKEAIYKANNIQPQFSRGGMDNFATTFAKPPNTLDEFVHAPRQYSALVSSVINYPLALDKKRILSTVFNAYNAYENTVPLTGRLPLADWLKSNLYPTVSQISQDSIKEAKRNAVGIHVAASEWLHDREITKDASHVIMMLLPNGNYVSLASLLTLFEYDMRPKRKIATGSILLSSDNAKAWRNLDELRATYSDTHNPSVVDITMMGFANHLSDILQRIREAAHQGWDTLYNADNRAILNNVKAAFLQTEQGMDILTWLNTQLTPRKPSKIVEMVLVQDLWDQYTNDDVTYINFFDFLHRNDYLPDIKSVNAELNNHDAEMWKRKFFTLKASFDQLSEALANSDAETIQKLWEDWVDVTKYEIAGPSLDKYLAAKGFIDISKRKLKNHIAS